MRSNNVKFKSSHVRSIQLVLSTLLVVAVFGIHRWLGVELAHAGAEEQSPAAEASERLREGTRLDAALGTFKATGDRWTFFTADGARRFCVLENLALERVERTMRENSHAVEWSISGVITEHQGVNYLLVTRAVLKTRLRQP